MSPPGILTPEQALANLVNCQRNARTIYLKRATAQNEVERLDREYSQAGMLISRAESQLKLAVTESVANEMPRT